jgi:GAF domain-containing protein
VPMRVRERTLGILTFATGCSGRRYDEQDLALAHELARRCATAIDNNRLYAERSLSVPVLSVKPAMRRRVGSVGGSGRVRADAQPYLGPRSGVVPERRHDG